MTQLVTYEEIIQKLRQIDVLDGQGMQRLAALREVCVTEETDYRWCKKYAGMGAEQLKELTCPTWLSHS